MGYPSLGVSDSIQSLNPTAALQATLGLLNATGSAGGGQSSPLPWVQSNINSKFFSSITIESNRWDSLFPYRLLVVDTKTNAIVGPGGGVTGPQISIQYSNGTSSSTIKYSFPSSVWSFQLPITPQQLNIQDNYSIQTSATLRGILEEHSGVRFKTISAQGSMGVWAQRSNITKPPSSPSLLQSIGGAVGGAVQSVFGGIAQSVNAFNSLATQVQGVINTATTGNAGNKPSSLRPESSDYGLSSTGYYQALKLQQFLEQYAEAKRDPNNASWRLVFDIPKQNQSFVVTPIAYSWQQSQNKPMEIMYNFQLKAWRRINLNETIQETPDDNQPLTPGILQNILNTINQAQKVLSASINLIGAVRSDVETPLNALRQTVLFVKGLSGVATTAADLPAQVISDYSSTIAAAINGNANSITSNVSDPTVVASIKAITSASQQSEGLSMNAVSSGQLGTAAATTQSLSTVNNIFTQSNANFTLLDQVPTSSLQLTNAQQQVLTNIVNTANETTVAQLKQYRGTILQLALQLSNNFGTGSAYYNEIYGLPPPTPRIQPITLDEYDILDSLYQTLQTYDILTATTDIDDNQNPGNMAYVAGLATQAGIEFEIPNSKIMAPVPFGLTIEGIAARYLGDGQRWLEIATLNNLREPYIDENGFQLPLLSNAFGRQVTIGDNTNLFVGQSVIVNGANQAPSARTILSIDTLSETSFLLTLDGLPNLDNFTLASQAYLQAYLPGTVNSQQKIFIPSDLPVPATSSITPPPSTSSDPLTGLSKVDWLLTDAGDIATNNYGDFRYSSGMTNIIQALRIKFGTISKTVITHPNFGLNVRVGAISSDLQMQELYSSINNMIAQDPRFVGVSNLQISLNGPVLGISLAVQLPGQTGVFPVSFALTS